MRRCCSLPLHARVRHAVSRFLFAYGRAVARCPWPFLVLPVLLLGELGLGLLLLQGHDPVLDDLDMPRDSRAFKDQSRVRALFPDHTGDHYDALELSEDQIMGSLIFTAPGNASVYDDDVIGEIRRVIADVKDNVTIEADGGVTLRYEDMCGRRHNACVVTGERLLAPQFNQMRRMGILTYPKWTLPTTGNKVDLDFALADSDANLTRVGVVRVTFKLRHDLQPDVFRWEEAFVEFMKTLGGTTNATRVVFTASSSVSREMADSFRANVQYVWISLALTAACCLAVTWGGDVVSTRVLLVPMGVVSPALGFLAATGLLSYCKIKVVETVWLVPLLVLGKGMTDMTLLMTAWSSRLGRGEDVAQAVGWCVAEVGGSITVTSLSLSLALCLGYTSSIPSVASFCLYAGVAVMFCYISTMMFGVGCLATHGRRVAASRHALTCRVTQPRDQLQKEGRSPCWAAACGGGGAAAEERYGDQGLVERVCRRALVAVTGSVAGKAVVGVLYLAVLSASVYGVMHVKQGVRLETLVSPTSHTHDYLLTDSRHFGFSFPVMFVMDGSARYTQDMADLVVMLMDKARRDPAIQDDFLRCWIVDFINSPFYNRTAPGKDFPGSVVADFLRTSETFRVDVVLDDSGEGIAASRCYVFTEKLPDEEDRTLLMQRMRSLAADAGFPVFAFHPAFLDYDQRLSTIPALLWTACTALCALGVLHMLLFPEPLTSLLTVTGAASVLLSATGLLHFLHVPLSFVSLTPLLLSAGFAVHFSASVIGAAYLQSEFSHRADRAVDAVARAASPLLLSALCIVGGVMVLLAATSYSVGALFKVTILTLLAAMFYGALFTPVVLSLLGPEKSQEEIDKDHVTKERILQRLAESVSNRTAAGHSPPTPPAGSKARSMQNGSPGQRYVNMGKPVGGLPKEDYENVDKNVGGFPKADYDNVPEGTCPHGLSSSSFQHASRPLSPGDLYHGAGQYENWTRRPNGADSRDVYDLPVSLPSTRSERRDGVRASGFSDTDLGGRSPGLSGRSDVSPPSSRHRAAVRGDNLPDTSHRLHNLNSPTSRGGAKQGTQTDDVVSGLKNLTDVFLDSSSYCYEDVTPQEAVGRMTSGEGWGEEEGGAVTSLEGVHQVACTLSTSGALGATQHYVTENFRDIPC